MIPCELDYSASPSRGWPSNGSASCQKALTRVGDDLEALFLSCFFEEEADINMHTLLLTKQKEGELVKDFIERFRELAMRSRSGMTPETLVETCRHNFLTPIFVQMGIVECKTWK